MDSLDPSLKGAAPHLLYPGDYAADRQTISDLQTTARGGYFEPFDAAIANRITAELPGLEPGGEYFERLRPVFTRGSTPTQDQIFDIGVDIGAAVCQVNSNPRGKILGFLNACLYTNACKDGLAGTTGPTHVLNEVQTYMADVVAEDLPNDPKVLQLMQVITGSLRQLHAREPENNRVYDLLTAKLQRLQQAYRVITEFQNLTKNFYTGIETSNAVTDAEISRVTGNIVMLNREAMRQRKYGTKPAYTEASIGGSWMFYDYDEYAEPIMRASKNIQIPRFAAVVFHSPHTNLRDLRLKVNSYEFGSTASLKQAGGALEAAEVDFGVFIGLDGNITLDPQGVQPIEVMLKERPLAAQSMKAEIASNFFDLSMPVYGQPGQLKNYAAFKERQKKVFDPIQQLLIPRMRFLQRPLTIAGSDDISRVVREHDVTWYVRPLPEGWHPSPEAVERAAIRGIELGDNETFVKAHKRGVGNPVAGYHAVRRAVELERP